MFTMYKLLVLVAFLFATATTNAQNKLDIDTAAIYSWPSLSDEKGISDDGKYFWYLIDNKPVNKSTLVVRSTQSNWIKTFVIVSDPRACFALNNKQLIFQSQDSVSFITLGTNHYKRIPAIECTYPKGKGIRWILFREPFDDKGLAIYDIIKEQQRHFVNVSNYWLNESGSKMVAAIKREDKSMELKIVDFEIGITKTIWETAVPGRSLGISNVVFYTKGQQLAFILEDREVSQNSPLEKSIWLYKEGMQRATKLVSSKKLDTNLLLQNFLRFSENGHWLLFNLECAQSQRSNKLSANVSIWSYSDIVIQPDQKVQANGFSMPITGIISCDGGNVIAIGNDYETMVTYDFPEDIVLVGPNGSMEPWWTLNSQPSYYLFSLKDKSKTFLHNGPAHSISNITFSPNGKCIVYFDRILGHYFSFEFTTGKVINLTKSIATDFGSENDRGAVKDAVGVGGWNNYGEKIILYDNYDLWLVDPSGKEIAVNITNSYGLRHKIKLRLATGLETSRPQKSFDSNEMILLSAFAPQTKYNGFYSKILNANADPRSLSMGPYSLFITRSQKTHDLLSFGDGIQPLKAKSATIWIVKKQTAQEAPNFYVTSDFKKFKALSDLQPEKNYNWLTAELITWTQLDGTVSQGVLYMPENFDRKKKYPIIFNYYEQLSHRLYGYPVPDLSSDNINIPWFVSRGYLVFIPDIQYKVASLTEKTVGEWAYNSIVSSAMYFGQFPYVDTSRMAIQGHSFGGLQTGYIVTHSNLFKAVCEASGTTDAVSAYLTLTPFASSIEHFNKQDGYETGQGRYGATLWERPDLYLKNSTVLNADKIETPILIMHNERDNNVPWRQGIELYMALRRLNKPSWMLQYDNGGHSVDGKDAVDYTIRMTQFFDHYLKDKPAPTWMTRGIPARLKQIETGYALDPAGNCGKDCKVCKLWNERMKKDSAGTMKEVKEMEGRW